MNRNSVTVTLTLKIEIHFSHMTLWLIMISHHTGFRYKLFSSQLCLRFFVLFGGGGWGEIILVYLCFRRVVEK